MLLGHWNFEVKRYATLIERIRIPNWIANNWRYCHSFNYQSGIFLLFQIKIDKIIVHPLTKPLLYVFDIWLRNQALLRLNNFQKRKSLVPSVFHDPTIKINILIPPASFFFVNLGLNFNIFHSITVTTPGSSRSDEKALLKSVVLYVAKPFNDTNIQMTRTKNTQINFTPITRTA